MRLQPGADGYYASREDAVLAAEELARAAGVAEWRAVVAEEDGRWTSGITIARGSIAIEYWHSSAYYMLDFLDGDDTSALTGACPRDLIKQAVAGLRADARHTAKRAEQLARAVAGARAAYVLLTEKPARVRLCRAVKPGEASRGIGLCGPCTELTGPMLLAEDFGRLCGQCRGKVEAYQVAVAIS